MVANSMLKQAAYSTPPLANSLLQEIYALPILIVDDNEINRVFLERTLQECGFHNLLAVASGEEALAQLPLFQPEMIILDIMMPGMNGFECCEAIRRQPAYEDLPVLIQTAISEPQLRVKAFTNGATDFVSKPVYPDELCARVLVHLQKRHALNILQQYKKRIELELESARQLQLAILPSTNELAEMEQRYHLSIAPHFQTCSEVGGDFWGMKNLFPHQTALWLVDLSGHGVAAALNAFRLQAYMKEHSPLAARPGEYLSHLNDKLLHLLLRGQFATMFYGIADTQGNKLYYACACAPHPILLRKATGKAELLDGSGRPLGTAMNMYATQTADFAPGDVLLLYSDALTETADAKGNFISEEQLIVLLEQHAGASAARIKQIVLDYFYWHAGQETVTDDLTITVCGRVN